MRVVSLLYHDVFLRDPAESGFSSQAADRYKLSLTAFEAQLAALARVRSDAPILLTALGIRDSGSGIRTNSGIEPVSSPDRRIPNPESRVPENGSRLPYAITVDDGGVSYYTVMADRLEALGWRGHCFVSTDFIGTPGFLTATQIRELDRRGHVIGSHTASHPYRFSARGEEEMRGEWSRSRHLLEDLLGHRVESASVPGGYFSRAVARTARDAGIAVLCTSEPLTAVDYDETCALVGRFTLRCASAPDASAKFVQSPWTRYGAWTSWNAKGLVKPLLGNSYVRVADWVSSRKTIDLSLPR